MTVSQITVHLLPDVKKEFDAYAQRIGLDVSEIAKLLIIRERHLRRLISSDILNGHQQNSRQRRGLAVKKARVTAHLSSVAQVHEFDAYAKSCNLNRNRAGAWLLTTELGERWLERALKLM